VRSPSKTPSSSNNSRFTTKTNSPAYFDMHANYRSSAVRQARN